MWLNTKIHKNATRLGVFMISQEQVLKHLDTYAKEIYSISIVGEKNPEMIINYNHIDKISPQIIGPSPHHIPSFKQIKIGQNDYEMVCSHEISISYPDVSILKVICENSNKDVRKYITRFIKKYGADVSKLSNDEAIWFMATVLGANE